MSLASFVSSPDDLTDVAGLFVELLRRPDWHAHARCLGFGTDAFFPSSGIVTTAKALCSKCPVRAECMEAGTGEQGIWGGMSERARRKATKVIL